ncbi:AraC family transcriptional regulator [Leifsonia sp. Leaf336]|nr:AraC family transcriptional regulator [Leifsonia sp. Leaf336]
MVIAANRAGVEIVAAVDNGRSALDAVVGGGIDLAVLDISMPGLNGVEVAEAIRGDDATKGTLILMVSASVQLLTDHGVVADRSDSFIIKPFSPRALSERIRSMLGLGEPA